MESRFQHEAEAATSISHPDVFTGFEHGTDAKQGLDFLAMIILTW